MMSLVVRVEDLQTGGATQSAFMRSPVRIGRSELNDLPLAQGFVSQWHAVVQFDEREIRYVDLGSTNGSAVDGARLERNVPVALGPEAVVRIGSLRLAFSRRATGEHRAVPQSTLFSMKAAALPASAEAHPPPLVAVEPPSPPDFPDVSAELAEEALGAASLDLDLLYASYRGSWDHLRARVDEVVSALDPVARAAAAKRLAERYPAAVQEPQFQELAGAPAAAAAAAPTAAQRDGPRGAGEAERLLATFAESYLPASVRVEGGAEVQAFLARMAEAIEAFARSFVEMRKGYEEFGRQMGVRTVHGDGPVQRAKDPRQLIAALLDPGQQGRAREVQAAFADYMVHQVALLNGVVEGARGVLRELSPEVIEARAPQSLWHLKAQTLWSAYQTRFGEIFEEEGALSDALFGREFGKAYTAIVGQRGAGDAEPAGEAEEPPSARAGRPRRR